MFFRWGHPGGHNHIQSEIKHRGPILPGRYHPPQPQTLIPHCNPTTTFACLHTNDHNSHWQAHHQNYPVSISGFWVPGSWGPGSWVLRPGSWGLGVLGSWVLESWGPGVLGSCGPGSLSAGSWGHGVLGSWGPGVMGSWGPGDLGPGVLGSWSLILRSWVLGVIGSWVLGHRSWDPGSLVLGSWDPGS